MGYPDTFTGFCVDGPDSWNKFHKAELKPKSFGDRDIDVQIDACGVCGSDVHTVTGGWGDFKGPLCVGHEVVGKAIKVGSQVKGIKVGDRVGVGAQVHACLKCELCTADPTNECYCQEAMVDTYNSQYPDGSWAHGGFASHIRAHEFFTFKIPDGLDTKTTAPLLCAGLTTYSPLFRAGVSPGKRVGIIGIGGLGHLAVQWSVALGAETYALTHSPHKVEDCKKLGAKDVIVTRLGHAVEVQFDLPTYFSLLKPGSDFHMVGLPDKPLPELMAQTFAANAPKLTGSHLGNHKEMEDMLQLAADKGVRPWVETVDISEKGCQEVVERVKANKVHYRFTLTGFDKAFGRA